MRIAALLFLSLAGISCAEEKKPEANQGGAAGTTEKKRLESVTWDLKSHKLVWVVQKGVEEDGKFVVKTTDRYEISPDDAVMAFSNEKRGFTDDEAASLHKLLDTLSLYCAESVVWWDAGEGKRVDPNQPESNKHRVEHHQHSPQPKAPPKRPAAPKPGQLIARR